MHAHTRTRGIWAGVAAATAAVSLCASPAHAGVTHRVPSARAAAPTSTPPPFTVLRRGDSGARVRKVQYALKKRGYRIAVNGKFGPLTHAAVRRFQRVKRLQVTGTVGPQTWKALGLPLPTGTPATSTTTTSVPSGGYRHPNASVERWHGVALQVGWAEQDWKHLSCIIQRESKGNPQARNASTAMGLLQIVYRVHRVWVGPDATVLYDPATNLRFGLKMFKGRGWKPWSSANNVCSD